MRTSPLVLLLSLALPLAVVLAPARTASAQDEGAAGSLAEVAESERVSLDEIRRFVSVFRAVKQAYVDPVDDTTLMQSAIRGLLADLDPHSGYLDADQSRDLSELSSGAYDGLGLEVVQRPDRSLMVVAPIDETPAARAGIRPGDVIAEIDDKPVTAANVDTAVESLRGEPGSEIRLTLLREGESEPLRLTLVRETIRVASVRGRLLAPGFGYLRISHFQADTGREAQRRLAAINGKDAALKGLVLDLRSNPGGLLNSAIEVADLFLEDGMIVSTRGRLPYASSEYRAKGGDALNGAPIVVLSDSGTASAAEVLAGALQDQQRALVMGSSSFGKGSVQTVLPLDNGDALKLTTARYYMPSGRSIQASGLVPDIALDEDVVLRPSGEQPPRLRESDLPGHLGSDQPAAAAPAAEESEVDDYAVREALTLLKGLAVFSGRKPG